MTLVIVGQARNTKGAVGRRDQTEVHPRKEVSLKRVAQGELRAQT